MDAQILFQALRSKAIFISKINRLNRTEDNPSVSNKKLSIYSAPSRQYWFKAILRVQNLLIYLFSYKNPALEKIVFIIIIVFIKATFVYFTYFHITSSFIGTLASAYDFVHGDIYWDKKYFMC